MHPRNPWLAALLAMLFPGLGHMYSGHLREALIVLLGPLFFAVVSLPIAVATDSFGVGIFVQVAVVYLLVYVAQIAWAAVLAKQAQENFAPRKYNSRGAYVSYALFALALSYSESWVLRSFVVEAFMVPSGSMTPGLLPGDRVFVTKLGDRDQVPERGDIVVVTAAGSGDKYLKRVIGLAGDEISVNGEVVVLNGEPLRYENIGERIFYQARFSDRAHWQPYKAEVRKEHLGGRSHEILLHRVDGSGQPDFGPAKVPHGHVFVLGDNRHNSRDSRLFGPVPVEHLGGRANSIWWSSGHDGLRTDRMGLAF